MNFDIYLKIRKQYPSVSDAVCQTCADSLGHVCYKNTAKPFLLPVDAVSCGKYEFFFDREDWNPAILSILENELMTRGNRDDY